MSQFQIKRIALQKPVIEFYEEGEWLRIVVPFQKDRFIHKEIAQNLIASIGFKSVEKKETVTSEKFLIIP